MIARPFAAAPADVATALRSSLSRGLDSAEAAQRLTEHGRNEPPERRRPHYARLALNQLLDPLVALLIAAAAISIAIGDTTEGVAIAAIIVLNGALSWWQEASAERAILALSQSFTQTALVIRDGSRVEIPAAEVVPGDLLVLEAGDRVAADARVIEARSLEVDESALTGESLPVAKQVEAVGAETPLAEQASMIFAGTGATRGGAHALVCSTGAGTQLGVIATLAAGAKPPPTPLTLRLGRLARQMVVAGVVITTGLATVILLRGGAWDDAFLTAVAVAVAAVPEGLAATVTAALALGAASMARRGAIVRRLPAIETLGETTVICTDKTGTLTENEIRVAGLRPAAGVNELELLEAAVLASNAQWAGDHVVGDPIEAALVLAAMDRGVTQDELLDGRTRVHELPFTSDRKLMTVLYAGTTGRHAFTKGAPEVVASLAREQSRELLATVDAWAEEGLRVLAVAARELGHADVAAEDVERDLRLLGAIALHDPLRPSAAAAVHAAGLAGIQVRMITGDHPTTARTIGHALGLDDASILARATPADKIALVEELQARGHVVAVTGDGVNDAPALRRADVGVAMGRSGTEAAREASSIVLTDDDFATIVAAVAEGRRIGDNVHKFVAFLLSANLGEVLVFAIAIGAGLGTPLAVIQILLVNLVTDGLPALALARDPASSETMTSPPRTARELFDRATWRRLGWIGVFVGAATLAAFGAGKWLGDGGAQTMAFATLALSELALVYGIRAYSTPAWRVPGNRWLDGAVAVSVALVVAVVFVPFAHTPFTTVGLDASASAIVLALSLVPLAGIELLKAWGRRHPRQTSVSYALEEAERTTGKVLG